MKAIPALLLVLILSSCELPVADESAMDYHIIEMDTDAPVVMAFTFAMVQGGDDECVDILHQLNPKNFVVTDLTSPFVENQKPDECYVQSSKTGIVYSLKVSKGDKIRYPRMQ